MPFYHQQIDDKQYICTILPKLSCLHLTHCGLMTPHSIKEIGNLLVYVMARHLFCTNISDYSVNWTLRNKLHRNFISNMIIFIKQNVFVYIHIYITCQMVVILSQPSCVKKHSWVYHLRSCLLRLVRCALTHWGRDKMDGIFQTTFSNVFFMNENASISINISLKFVPKGSINNIPINNIPLVGTKPLSEPYIYI